MSNTNRITNSSLNPALAGTTPAASGSGSAPPRYRGAFQKLQEKIRSLAVEQLATVNLDVMASVRTTEGVLPKIANMRAAIIQRLPQFPTELFDELEDRALALGHAQTVYESAQQPVPILPSLSVEANKAYDIARSDVTTLVHRGLLPAQTLSNLNSGNGYRNLAADLFKLSEALRSHWSNVVGRTSMTTAELDRLEDLADQINQALGIREQMPKIQATAARDRQAAYTLFIEAYDEVRSAIAYVRRKEDDVDTIMPSLYAGRSIQKKKPAVDEPTKPNPGPEPAVNISNAAAGTPAPTPVGNAPADQHAEPASPKAAILTATENGRYVH